MAVIGSVIKVIGIAGGIGSGKSVVSRIMRLNGYPVYDCDYEARRLMEEAGGKIRRQLSERFGYDLYRKDGTLDRKRLAAEIFGCEEARRFVNSVVHACVKDDFVHWIETHRKQGDKTLFVESAILVSSGMITFCDEVMLVDAPEEERIRRAVSRGLSRDDAEARVQAQRSEREETLACGIPVQIIDNGENGESLLEIPAHIHQMLYFK